jgi:hypothetical protein
MANETETGRRRVARLFDVRLVIGGLFVLYGVILIGMGLFDSPADLAKAQGVHINIWMGIAMLVFGLLMLLWLRLSPPEALPEPGDDADTVPSDEGDESPDRR